MNPCVPDARKRRLPLLAHRRPRGRSPVLKKSTGAPSRNSPHRIGRHGEWRWGSNKQAIELQARLGGADWIDDTEFAAYGLDEQAITRLRQWAQTWASDIGERLQELEAPHED